MNTYKVYQVDELNYGDGRTSQNKTYLRTTKAVSEKKAIANTKYVLGIKPSDLFCYYAGDGCRRSHLIAELV